MFDEMKLTRKTFANWSSYVCLVLAVLIEIGLAKMIIEFTRVIGQLVLMDGCKVFMLGMVVQHIKR
jgi:hypothetical protein